MRWDFCRTRMNVLSTWTSLFCCDILELTEVIASSVHKETVPFAVSLNTEDAAILAFIGVMKKQMVKKSKWICVIAQSPALDV